MDCPICKKQMSHTEIYLEEIKVMTGGTVLPVAFILKERKKHFCTQCDTMLEQTIGTHRYVRVKAKSEPKSM